ncbi:hypothetical protein K470DRAFT_266164 [Piedraia hortae CBS 480.64]|uniref:Phosphatidate phosphatase APP1 catalytic domain-containing protein n=1 Tax=Piedraia hortae CBS 480.64 TaxID=1314780 RepID=A0A6A7BUV2_9PEZI|nr:hypothetical protein K470DRAFT_266164 [Piedraia hortae CBS 480.64]
MRTLRPLVLLLASLSHCKADDPHTTYGYIRSSHDDPVPKRFKNMDRAYIKVIAATFWILNNFYQIKDQNLFAMETLGNAIDDFIYHSIDNRTLPLRIRNLNTYAFWSPEPRPDKAHYPGRWIARVHGRMFKMVERTPGSVVIGGKALTGHAEATLNSIPQEDRGQALDLTTEIYSHPIFNHPVPPLLLGSEGHQKVTLLRDTELPGTFNEFAPLDPVPPPSPNAAFCIKRIQSRFESALNSQGEINLVPPEGVTIIADIDAVLREAEKRGTRTPDTAKFNPKKSAFKPFVPWLNMPHLFAQFAPRCDVHFHYITNAPLQLSGMYTPFLKRFYPPGSYDIGAEWVEDANEGNINLILETFPERKFVLFLDLEKKYNELRPVSKDQILAVFVRGRSKGRIHAARLKRHFRGIPIKRIYPFKVPDDIKSLDFGTFWRGR